MNTNTLSEAQDSVRLPNGRFKPGHGIGRPRGSRSKFNKAVLDRLAGLTDKAMTTLERKLDEGDLKAAMFVLARFLPSERVIDLPAEPNDIADALNQGDLSPVEIGRLSLAVRSLKEAAGVDEMRARLDEIEALLLSQRKGL